ncbi:MAG: hypothetical protein EFKGCFLK_00716 [Rhodocyclaceae bacterium]|nr:hypothetical protein [Zoogloeaceae bacterium]MBV6407163.1 hypothetical protein [Rhodocyclaceae bacterium]MCK6383606.1 hypothetical protein [Rhodocyclaceae bacterium]CAG0929244.1 hypothetical protein RHDC3_01075 [Rhodocyclaceae bacterium]
MIALDRPQLDKLLDEAAADYGLDLATPQGLTAALLAVNTLLLLENTRILRKIQEAFC